MGVCIRSVQVLLRHNTLRYANPEFRIIAMVVLGPLFLASCHHPPAQLVVTQVITSDTPGSSGGNAICLDKGGNLIVAGVFENDFTLGGTVLHSYGRHDIFLAKIDRQQHVLWVEAFGGPGNDFSPGVVVDDDGDITLCCDFENMLNLTSRFALYCDGHGQALIRVGADGSGKEVLEVQAKSGIHETQINSACVDAAKTVHAVGNFTADTLLARRFKLDGSLIDSAIITAQGSATLFVLSRTGDGAHIALHGYPEDGSVYALTNRIAASADGRIALCGTHNGKLAFGKYAANGNGAYFALLDANGEPLVAKQLPLMCSNPTSLSIDGLCVDDASNAYALMGFKDNIHSQDMKQKWAAGIGKDVLLMRIDANGDQHDVKQLGNGDDLFTKGVAYDKSRGLIMIAGYYHGQFDIDDKVKLPMDGKFNSFVLGLDKDLAVRTIDRTSGKGQQFMLAMDTRDGSVAFTGTYFGAGSIGEFALPMPATRFFAGSMESRK